jgi:hypothetical protein
LIKFNIILFGFSSFFTIFIIHLIIWRIFRPKNDLGLLLILFIFIPFIIFALLLIYNTKNLFFLTNPQLILIFLFYFSFGLAYTQFYPGLKESSPTLAIINLLGRKKDKVRIETINEMFSNHNLIDGRIISLKKIRLIKTIKINKEEELILTKAGQFFAKFFFIYRRILGLEEGKG